jgi:type IV pilus assembly protein PilW
MRPRLNRGARCIQRGVGLIEVMVGIVIAMLLVLVIYQIYEISEAQKRTITAGSDAQQNAAFGLYVLGRDLAIAGNGIASSAATLYPCALLRPIPVLIEAGASAADPDKITVLFAGSGSLATPVPFQQNSTVNSYVVRGPVAFSPKDVVAAVQGATCTVSKIDAGAGSVAVDPATGFATLSVTPVAGDLGAVYSAVTSSLVNLGPAEAMGRIAYTVDATTHALRTQRLLPNNDPVAPLVSDVVNLKAQYGLDTDNDGIVNSWQDATGAWAAANVPALPLATLQQVRAIRVAIVTRSAQYEKDPVTTGPLVMFDNTLGGHDVSMSLTTDDTHYRYKVLETVIPLRNALWNPS